MLSSAPSAPAPAPHLPASIPPASGSMPSSPSTTPDPVLIQDCLRYLGRKDDTSRFVGLTLLLSLTRQLDQAQFHELMLRCTRVLDGRFLDRLLKSGANNATMTELAANVAEALGTALVANDEVEYLVARVPCLMQALSASSASTQDVINRSLFTLSTTEKGASAIISSKEFSTWFASLHTSHIARQAFVNAIRNAKTNHPELIRCHIVAFVEYLTSQFQQRERSAVVDAFATLDYFLKTLESEVFIGFEKWVYHIYDAVHTFCTGGSSSNERTICIGLIARLSDMALVDLFSTSRTSTQDPKTSLFLFVQLLTIDLRAAYPELLEKMHSTEYAILSSQQCDRLDVLCKFIVFLVSLDDASEVGMEPSLVLRLRADMSESMAMTIEFVRDRWDDISGNSESRELARGVAQIRRPSYVDEARQDPLIMSAIQTLSIWLKEEGSLHEEGIAIMDIFLTLWSSDWTLGVDYRHFILCALQAFANEKEGRQRFLALDGWTKLWKDVHFIHKNAETCSQEELLLAIDTARLISDVLRLETVGQTSWVQDALDSLESVEYGRARKHKELITQLRLALFHVALSCCTGICATLGPGAANMSVDKLRNHYRLLAGEVEHFKDIPWISQYLDEIADDLVHRH